MRRYIYLLAFFYTIGALLHGLDLLSLRLNFEEMSSVLKIWIIYLFITDTVAAIGLWQQKKYGEYAFISIAIVQLTAYIFFIEIFGDQLMLILFHITTLAIYSYLRIKKKV